MKYEFAAGKVEQEVRKLLAEFPDIAGDEELKVDMLEGETDLFGIMEKLALEERLNTEMHNACHALIDKIAIRRNRFKRRKDYTRQLIQKLLEAADVKSIDVPAGKISVVNSPDAVIVTDEDAIPEEFVRIKREPNKTAIKDAIKSGKSVPGATLSNGGSKIQIR